MDLKRKLGTEGVFETIAICHKDREGKVLYQNERCKKLCGDRKEQKCLDNCMELYKNSNSQNILGTHQFRSKNINETDCDIIMINDGNYLTTLLYDLADQNENDKEFFKKFNLTKREYEIVGLILSGETNKFISEKLFISPKTLKTHINHILRKIPKSLLRRN